MVTTNSVSGSSTAVGGGRPRESLGKIDENYQNFLTLLTTQLKNQDPSDPTDTNQLTQQIATLSQVEQQLKTNENLEKLVGMYSATQYNSVVSYIGKKIEAEGDAGALKNGRASFSYNLSGAANDVKLIIRDRDGNLVRTDNISTIRNAGGHTYNWDGKDNQGNVAGEGEYTLTVEARLGNSTIPATGTAATLRHTKPEFVYYLAQDAASLTVTIKDKNGGIIRRDTTGGTKIAGRNAYVWDGKDNNGNAMPEGEYKIEIAAKDNANRDIVARTFMTGVVTSVDSVNGAAFLSIGDIAIPLERVTSIRLAS
jgi:flagellar basal-body rod modification protein FlgD